MGDGETRDSRAGVDAALISAWIERHARDGSHPKKERGFASIESALLFDRNIQRKVSGLRRVRMCLPSLLHGQGYDRVEVNGSDLARWGAHEWSSDFKHFGDWHYVLAALHKAELAEDLREWKGDKRVLRLRGVRLDTNRRRAKTQVRSNESLSEGVATFVVPRSVFAGDRLADLSRAEFLTLMAVYALTDMATFGGADPSHIRISGGRLLVSEDVCCAVRGDAEVVRDALITLETVGFIWFVPSVLDCIDLPSASPTYEVIAEGAGGASSGSMIVRPQVLASVKHGDWVAKSVADTGELVDIDVSVEREWPLRITVMTGSAVPQVPQYDAESHSDVVVDRVAASFKKQVTTAIPDFKFHRSDIRLGISDDGARVGLVHAAKLVLDAMSKAKTISGDTKYVVESLDICREPIGTRGIPHVLIDVTPLDEEGKFSRRLYVDALEWRPPARSGAAYLSGYFPSYASYIQSLTKAADSMANVSIDVERVSREPMELAVHVDAPYGDRFDPDNVALFACDLLTMLLSLREFTTTVDRLVDRVIVTHGEGRPSATIEIRPLNIPQR